MSTEMEKKIQPEEAVRLLKRIRITGVSPLQNPTASMTAPTARIPATSDRGGQSGFCKSAHTIQWVVCAFAYNYPLQNWNKCAILNKWIFPAADAGKPNRFCTAQCRH